MDVIDRRYETRVVAYGDILGWADKCKDGKEFDRLFKAVKGIALHGQGFSQKAKESLDNAGVLSLKDVEEHNRTEFSFFSDNFAISAPVEFGEAVFNILSWRTTNLLQSGFIVRGGVTIGQLYHDPEVIFGPALVEAVHIEKDAGFPRFLCSNRLFKHLDSTSYKNHVLCRDCYEDWIVNTWCGTQFLFEDLMKIIQQEILHMTDNKMMKEKDIRKWQYIEEMLPQMYELKKHTENQECSTTNLTKNRMQRGRMVILDEIIRLWRRVIRWRGN